MRAHRIVVPVLLVASSLAVVAGGPARATTKVTDVRVAMSDGVRLAADVYIPSVADGDGDGRYPCVVEVTPYRKEARASEGASFLPGAGIALIEVDARGTGGSEGEYDIVFSVREQQDTVEWIDWAAATATKPNGQPLCEQTVGMYGGSYSGIIQYLTASLPLGPGDEGYGRLPTGTPNLAAIAPQRAYGDLYRDIVYHGGMVIASFGVIWSSGTSAYYLQPPTDAQTADGRAAYADHLTGNDPMIRPYLDSPYADATFTADDSPAPGWSQRLYEDSSTLPRIGNLRVPTLHLAGWYDSFTRGQLLTFQEAYDLEQAGGERGPNFLIVGPWNHTGTHFISPDQGYKAHLGEWYRYWLEDRANDVAAPAWVANGFGGKGERIRYFQTQTGTINAQSASDGAWVDTADWPPPAAVMERLYLAPGGALSAAAPGAAAASAVYASNSANGRGEVLSRWDNAAGTPQPQLDQRLDQGAVAYQTAPLAAPLRVAGPIAMRLRAATLGAPGDPSLAGAWPGVAQTAPPYLDTDFVVKISEVAPDGSARLVTQGYLRASHRSVDLSRSHTLGGELVSPFHPHTLAALDPPSPGVARDYDLEIWPIAKTFRAGHRLRIDISSADTPNHLTLLNPTVNEITHALGASYIALPIVP